MRIAAIQIGDERARVADCSHDRRNRRRVFDAERRLPAKLPARSDVRAKTESFGESGGVSTRSRTSEATLRPVSRDSERSRRSVESESLIVMPFMAMLKGNLILTGSKYLRCLTWIAKKFPLPTNSPRRVPGPVDTTPSMRYFGCGMAGPGPPTSGARRRPDGDLAGRRPTRTSANPRPSTSSQTSPGAQHCSDSSHIHSNKELINGHRTGS